MLEESKIYKGFFKSDLISNLIFSEDGKVINILDKYCPLPKLGMFNNYLVINCNGTIEILHRLMCKVFYPRKENDYDNLFVNHKDGNKYNNHKDNLEWCTASENCLHAYKTGLRTDNKVLFVRCLRTKEVTRYYSLQEAARNLKVNGGIITKYLQSDRKLPFRHFWSIWSEQLPEIEYSEEQIKDIRKGLPKTVVVEEQTTKKTYVFESCAYAADYFDICKGTMRLWINDGRWHKDLRIWFVHDYQHSLDDAEKLERHQALIKNNKVPNRTPVSIEVTDLRTNEIQKFKSTQEFADLLGVKKNTIQKRVLVNNGVYGHFLLKYLKLK